MPKRKSVRKIPSPEIQGDDSFVVIKPMTYGEQKTFRIRMRELEKIGDVGDDADAETREAAEQKVEDAKELEGCKMMADWVTDWNWVGDDGEPLPKPEGKPEVIDSLLTHEVLFLISTLSGDEEELKN